MVLRQQNRDQVNKKMMGFEEGGGEEFWVAVLCHGGSSIAREEKEGRGGGEEVKIEFGRRG